MKGNQNKKRNIPKNKKVKKEEKKEEVETKVEVEKEEEVKVEKEEVAPEVEEPPMKKVKEATKEEEEEEKKEEEEEEKKEEKEEEKKEEEEKPSVGLGFALFNSAQNAEGVNTALLDLFGTESLKSQEPVFVPPTLEELKAKYKEDQAKAREEKKVKEEERKRSLLEKDRSTIFVGNVPVNTKEKELRKVFRQYGAIESIRFRSIPLKPKGKEPLRVAFHRGAFVDGRDTMCAYVVYKSMESVDTAVKEANNLLFKDKHLRVDSASGNAKYSTKKTVFIGNLPHDAKEEELRKLFEECGTVNAVRIVRGKGAKEGTGIAFVEFADRASVTTAVMKNGEKFMENKIRVTPCLDTEKSKGALEKQKREYEKEKKLRRRGVKGGANQEAQKRGFAPVKSKKTTKPVVKKKRKHGKK